MARSIEEKLGRPLDSAREGAIADLNQVPHELVAEARTLPRIERRELLTWATAPSTHAWLVYFINQVVVGGADPSTWLRGAVWCSAPPLDRLLSGSRKELLGPVLTPIGSGAPPSELTRIRPDAADWRAGNPVGAIALWRSDARYDTLTPPHVLSAVANTFTLEPITDLDVAIRRWIACSVARELPSSPTRLTGPRLSVDAQLALAGLEREARELPPLVDGEIPGFRGPDDWYRE